MTRIELPPSKKVGHLTLLRESRPLSIKEFNLLQPDERLDIIRLAQGRQKHELLVTAKDGPELLPRLPAQEVYLLVKELGIDDVADLIPMASPEQFAAFLDLDGWQGDELQEAALIPWLAALLDGGEDVVLQAVANLDYELLALWLRKLAKHVEGPEDDQEEQSREDSYRIEFHDSEQGKVLSALLDVLQRREPEFYCRLLEGVRSESRAVLEEECYTFRNGRMQDLGFPDPIAALEVFSYLPPQSFRASDHSKAGVLWGAGEESVAPGFVLTTARPRAMLAEVLNTDLPVEIAWELTYLLNKVLLANRVEVGDLRQVEGGLQEVFNYLNLALEHLAGDDVDTAAESFSTIYLQSLFQLGFSLTVDLQRRAQQLNSSSIGPYLDGPFRALVTALDRRRPQFYVGLEEETRGDERPFARQRDLNIAAQWLDRLELQRRLFEEVFPFRLPAPAAMELQGCQPDAAEDLTLSEFFLTALANRLLGEVFLPTPLAKDRLAELHSLVCVDGELSPELRQETLQWLEEQCPGSSGFGEFCLDVWAEEFCSVEQAKLDPRYVGGLIIRMDKNRD